MDFEEQDEEMEEIAGSYDSLAAAKSAPMAGGGGGRYRECLKNHAVGLGGHAVDGCGEFLAAGPEGTLDALKCAACACHRNFHRREAEAQLWPYYRTASGYLQVRPLALAAEQEEAGGPSKKRFRTKFTAEQKERMLGLAERLGWRIQKQDESIVQEFCSETGLRRHVLKVWMHNNKHTLGKKP